MATKRLYGDPAGGGGFSPSLPSPPPAPTPDQLVRPSNVAIPTYGSAPVFAPQQHQPPQAQAPQSPVNWLGSIFGLLGNPLANQLAFQQRPAPVPEEAGPPFPWQRPAWQREGFPSEAAYQADLAKWG